CQQNSDWPQYSF
nr:immunoglobulin light chain junction region [Macaca mulatta]MPN91050.1 immunoglobulin light chain junction region [Macaca mulatta]MPN91091.1 immunoglobulin light chain junction region [Macaca mulatta]MPN91165.1 immunoglobulin light chain junction region [Macaca mulatta]MPN91202.1 immunoglobulin light chain junction region [Macaca mulatta]